MATRRSGTRPQDFAVDDLLGWIHSAELVLPEFQRDYDWSDDRVVALAATIMCGWPAGSLLLQETGGPTFFRVRPFADGPDADEDHSSLVVLDGQQRLTALYHALYDVGLSVYAIRASALCEDRSVDSIEEGMHAFDRATWDREFRNAEFTPECDWIPLYSLRTAADYFAWRDAVAGRSPDSAQVALSISDAFRNGLERVHKFRFPAVIVESALEPAAIARIFERVNRQGLALKTFDLMVARTFAPNWNLRDRWTEACDTHPVLERFFGDDGMSVIRVIALTSLANVREQAVLNMEATLVRLEWDAAVEATASAVTFMEQHCGVTSPGWIPYGGMVVTLGALAREWPLSSRPEMLLRWFLSRGLGLRFEAGANTVTVEEYRHLQNVFKGTEDLKPISIPARMIGEATRRRQGAIWRTFLCSLSLTQATQIGVGDFPATTPIALFPKVASSKGMEPMHHRVLNQVLATKEDARKLVNAGLDPFRDHLESLSPEISGRVRRAQFLNFDFPLGTSREDFIRLRLGAFDRWLRTQLGYGLEGVAAEI